jgi:aspartate racemase
MRLLGIVGGIAPESTVEYYRLLVATYRERTGDGSYPPLVINSIDLTTMLDLIAGGRLAEVTSYLLTEIERLARAGADVALLASNTPHIVFDDLARQSPVPLLSIVEAACDAARGLGLRRVGLIGTRFTMQGGFYRKVFERQSITVCVPAPEDQAYIHVKYLGELVHGIYLPETRARLLQIGARLAQTEGIEGLILGGTELPLLLRDGGDLGIPLLDTTRIHVDRAIAEMLSPTHVKENGPCQKASIRSSS